MNTSVTDDRFIEVPEPLFKFKQNNVVLHDTNQRLIDLHKEQRLLDKREAQRLQKRHLNLNKQLKRAKVDQILDERTHINHTIDAITETIAQLVTTGNELEREYNAIYDDDMYSDILIIMGAVGVRIMNRICDLQEQRRVLKAERRTIDQALSPHRQLIRERNRIRSKLQAHHAAIDDEQKQKALRLEMAKEAIIIADRISRELARMEFKHDVTVRGKTKRQYVLFDYVIATPDQIQLKIHGGRQGLFGGNIPLLPHGVLVTDILKDRIMDELTSALEREVWSPHLTDNASRVNGTWLVVERLGLVEGIPSNVTYKQLMARYETANHERFPLPAGLKRGRRINWLEMDSPQGYHLMFTGISGSGKSNAMRAMISALIEKQSARDIVFVFIDLKRQGDFKEFEDAPHCLRIDDTGVLENIDDVVLMLQQVQSEMHMRQKRIGAIAKNLTEYNRKADERHRMPRVVVVFDEYANTRRARYEEQASIIDDICIEIGQVGRASGIHLMIGIQQPRRDNMPSPLRDNITTQLVGHQANIGASQSVTGNRDSLKIEDIPGRFLAFVGHNTEKVQMPFITDDDVQRAVDIARQQHGDTDPYQLHYDDGITFERPTTDEETVLQAAFMYCDGALKARPIWEQIKDRLSHPRISKAVKSLIEQDEIEYNDMLYVPVKVTNYYRLEKVETQSELETSGETSEETTL